MLSLIHIYCVAYINADSPGSRFGVIPLVRSTLSEKPGYFEDAVRDVAGACLFYTSRCV